jgi:hypothetical protein
MSLAGNVVRVGTDRRAPRILQNWKENTTIRRNRRWILKWMFKKYIRRVGLESWDSEWGPVEGSCEHCNEPPGSIKCWEVLEGLHNWRLLKKGLPP